MLNDPEFLKIKNELLSFAQKRSSDITSIRPSTPSLKASYEKTLKEFTDLRGLPLWHPYLGSGRGNGALVELCDGSVKYDFISGIGVHFGHSHPKLIASSIDAALQNTIMQGHLQQNIDSYELTKLLINSSGLDHCLLTTSGAMSVENGLKIAFQKNTPKNRLLAFEHCFMGRTLSLANLSDEPAFREGLPNTLFVDYIPFYDPKEPEVSQKRAVSALKTYLERYPDRYACMCFELIQGEGGFYSAPREFFRALMQILKEHHVLVLIDEVQTFGRTDALFAFQSLKLETFVDVVTVGKLAQVCATLYRDEVKPKPGLISQTFTSSTSAIFAAMAIIKSLLEEGFLGENGKNMQIRKHFLAHLEGICARHSHIAEGPFGSGMMIAFTPFKGEKERVHNMAKALFEKGVICFVAGREPTRLRFLVPAGGVSLHDIDQVAHILEETLKQCQ